MTLFGPASEKIDVNAFIESAKILYQDTLPVEPSLSIADECRFHISLPCKGITKFRYWQRFRHSRFSIWFVEQPDVVCNSHKEPRKYHCCSPCTCQPKKVAKDLSYHGQWFATPRGIKTSEEYRLYTPYRLEVTIYYDYSYSTLKASSLNTKAVPFMRTPRNSDHNILQKVVRAFFVLSSQTCKSKIP